MPATFYFLFDPLLGGWIERHEDRHAAVCALHDYYQNHPEDRTRTQGRIRILGPLAKDAFQ